MQNIPVYIGLLFGLTTFLTVFIFYRAAGRSGITLIVLLSWLLLQGIAGLSGFYTVTAGSPPRFILLILPPLLLIIVLFVSSKGKRYLGRLDLKILTLLHVVRIPVELVLWALSVHKMVPQLMTFEGRNFDIIAGLTAPFVYYFGFIKNKISGRLILVWNFICLGTLINIAVNAVLSAPFAFQRFAFDQPNRALLYFPYIWLPACVVPLVLCSHLVSIWRLLKGEQISSRNSSQLLSDKPHLQ